MAGNSKSRKRRFCRAPSFPQGGFSAIARAQLLQMHQTQLPPENQTNTVTAYHVAIDAMTTGSANLTHFDTLVYAMNIAVILMEQGLGDEDIELIRAAQDGLARAKARYLDRGKLGLDGDALQALKAAAIVHEAHVAVATRGELEDAINEMHARVERGNIRQVAAQVFEFPDQAATTTETNEGAAQ